MKLTWTQILHRFEVACVAQNWKGSIDPADRDEVLADYKGWQAIMRKIIPSTARFDISKDSNAKIRQIRSGSRGRGSSNPKPGNSQRTKGKEVR